MRWWSALALVLGVAGLSACASTAEPRAPSTGAPTPPPATAAALTGGVGNHVVDSFDELRAAVGESQRAIDACWIATRDEPGWRETVVWEVTVDRSGHASDVHVVEAEFWREGRIVSGKPGPRLLGCMERVLGQLVVRAREPGKVRLRFEPI